jgi:cell division protease FtsH
MIDKRQSWNLGYWLVALLLLAFVQSLWQGAQQFESVPYSAFEKALAEGRVAEVVVSDRSMTGRLKSPDGGKSVYGRLGGRVPKGVLLVGPPGTGKTLLAKAVAGEAGVPFFSISGSEFVEMFVGVGAARVRDLFEQARPRRRRSSSSTSSTPGPRPRRLRRHGRPRREGADPQPAAGRARRLRFVQRPGAAGRHQPPGGARPGAAARRPLRPPGAGGPPRQEGPHRHPQGAHEEDHPHPDVDADQVAALTPGFSGADLANLVNEAALVATRRDGADVTLEDFTVAIERIVAGLEKKNRVLNEHERTVVAYHEMGHALVAMGLPGTDPVHKISIIPRGVGALGYTIQRPTEDRFLMTRAELENKMAVLLGGRAAEQLVFGEVSTGAADDLQKVTSIARSIVMRFGMVTARSSSAAPKPCSNTRRSMRRPCETSLAPRAGRRG